MAPTCLAKVPPQLYEFQIGHKIVKVLGVVAHAFNSYTWEAEADGSLSSRTARDSLFIWDINHERN